MNEVSSTLYVPTHTAEGVALFIDGDNLSPDYLNLFLEQAENRGTLVYKRVYGNSHKVQCWGDKPGLKFIYSGSGKNSSDLLLTIHAVDFPIRARSTRL